jgi:hypothetical protein
MTLADRLEVARQRDRAAQRDQLVREHRDHRRFDVADCPLCERRPRWARSMRAKELER